MKLLVRLLSDEEGVKYLQTKLYVKMGFAQESVRTLLETASQVWETGFSKAVSDTGNSKA